jgi:hypothetical protein
MIRTAAGAIALMLAISSFAAACSSGGRGPTPAPTQTPPPGARLTQAQAIDAARENAGFLMADDDLAATSAEFTTFEGAYEILAPRGIDPPLPGESAPPNETPVWLVVLTGLFYERQPPPPPPPATPPPHEPVCADVVVIIDDNTGTHLKGLFLDSGACS